MIHYIKGKLIEKNPAYVIVECNSVGYLINISLHTYSQLPETGDCCLFTHMVIKNEATTPVGLTMYGFYGEEERNVFLGLTSVSGVGNNTARLILSSMSPGEVQETIVSGNVALLQKVKGIGGKTAQRIIVDLKDKFTKEGISKGFNVTAINRNPAKEEATAALIMLGFAKPNVEKAIEKLLRENPSYNVEEMVKMGLKIL